MNGQPKYEKSELIRFVKDFYNDTGKIPRQKDFLHDRSKPSFKQYIDVWGSWNNMLLDIGLIQDRKRPVNMNDHICSYCGKHFKAYGKRKYCSTECKTLGQRKYEGNTNSSNPTAYRTVAFKNYDWKCCVCGYEEDLQYTKGPNKSIKYPVILDVHHLDGNREHNNVDNLCILCPTCHAKVHRGIISIERLKPFKKVRVIYQPVFGGLQNPLNSQYGDLQ